MTLPDRQDPECGTCHETFPGSLAVAMSLGWGYWDGTTEGGNAAEYVICKACRTEGRRRPVKPVKQYEEDPLF